MIEHSEELPTDPKGTEPPAPIDLVSEMRSVLAHLLDEKIGGLRGEIVDATTTAAFVGEQLHRFNNQIDLLIGQVDSLQKRQTLTDERVDRIEERVTKLEGK